MDKQKIQLLHNLLSEYEYYLARKDRNFNSDRVEAIKEVMQIIESEV